MRLKLENFKRTIKEQLKLEVSKFSCFLIVRLRRVSGAGAGTGPGCSAEDERPERHGRIEQAHEPYR